MSLLASTRQHRALVVQTLRTLATLDGLKGFVFYYVLISYARKLFRHIRARGLVTSVVQWWRAVSRVRIGLPPEEAYYLLGML